MTFRILLVDDSAVVRQLHSFVLRAGGFETAEADSGFAALEVLNDQPCGRPYTHPPYTRRRDDARPAYYHRVQRAGRARQDQRGRSRRQHLHGQTYPAGSIDYACAHAAGASG